MRIGGKIAVEASLALAFFAVAAVTLAWDARSWSPPRP